MNAGDDGHDLARLRRLDEHCDRYEDGWCTGRRPSIEAYLDEVPDPDRPPLLRKLIAIEVELRRVHGEHPTPSEYHERFLEHDHPRVRDLRRRTAGRATRLTWRSNPRNGVEPGHRSQLAVRHPRPAGQLHRSCGILSAFNTWTEDKTRPLGCILVQQGKLDDNRHELLVALVAEHLKVHGGDPDRSLAALNPLGPVRRELEHLADAALAASLGHVGTSRTVTSDPDATLNWAGTSTSGGARFTVIRLHARGGLGEVFAATDEELHREVALKRSRITTQTTPKAGRDSSWKPRSPKAWNTPASCRSKASAPTPMDARSTRCAW